MAVFDLDRLRNSRAPGREQDIGKPLAVRAAHNLFDIFMQRRYLSDADPLTVDHWKATGLLAS